MVDGESRVHPSYVLSLFAIKVNHKGYEYEDMSDYGCDVGEVGNMKEGDNCRSYPPVARYSIRESYLSAFSMRRSASGGAERNLGICGFCGHGPPTRQQDIIFNLQVNRPSKMVS